MQLTEEQKTKIQQEFDKWQAIQYAGKSKEDRQKKGQFFTLPILTIKMLEKFESVTDKDILDPTSGAGGLLAAAILAGADPKRTYGIELDPEIAAICRKRLAKLGVPRHHIHVGNALETESYVFPESKYMYSVECMKSKKAARIIAEDRLGKVKLDKTFDMTNKNSIKDMHKILKKFIEKELECIKGENIITMLASVFNKLDLEEL